MNTTKSLAIGLVSLFSIAFLSCKKEAGTGGKTTLSGKLLGTYICEDDGRTLVADMAVPDERIYISYDATGELDDDVRTAPDGTFKFEYLQPGKYSIITYSECMTCPTGKVEVIQEIEIPKKEDELELETTSVLRITGRGCNVGIGAGKGGVATLTGKLIAIYIDDNEVSDTLGIEGQPDTRVYIIYGDGTTQSDDVRSSADGSFEFKELKAGNYTLYAMSECKTLNCPSGLTQVSTSVTISATDTNFDAGELIVIDFRNP
jgi:hypothetical protein|tara:strand:+ start:204 stop:986 length:783 start_codon:yes stop_codon:yes gene_type:complete